MIIRNFNLSDINFAFKCTKAEGWLGESHEDFESFFAYDRNGCFIAEADEKKIGLCVAVKYQEYGFIGELIVIKEMRKHGIGRRLLEHAINYLHDNGIQNILLDADLSAVSLYEKAGFRKICQSLRLNGKINGTNYSNIRHIKPDEFETINKIDRRIFGDDRNFFLNRQMTMYPKMSKVMIQNNQITGYIFSRQGNGVISIGPWIVLKGAENPGHLLESMASEFGNEILRIGVLETNLEAMKTIQSFKSFENYEPSWRMALGPSSELGMDHQSYAVGSASKG